MDTQNTVPAERPDNHTAETASVQFTESAPIPPIISAIPVKKKIKKWPLAVLTVALLLIGGGIATLILIFNKNYCMGEYCFVADFPKTVFDEEDSNMKVWFTTTNNKENGTIDSSITISDGCIFQPGIKNKKELQAALKQSGFQVSSSDLAFEWITFNGRAAGFKEDSDASLTFFCSEDYQKTFNIITLSKETHDRLVNSFIEK